MFVAIAIALPLLGVWIASSLAALQNGSMALVALAGLLAFPLLPLGWDALAMWRRQRASAAGRVRPQVLTFFDRFVLRTLVVNVAFVGGLLAMRPAVVFEALSARGDWMLDGIDSAWADRTRAILFASADRLEWLHEATRDNPYADLVQTDEDDDGSGPVPTPTPVKDARPVPEPDARDDGGPVDPFSDGAWPFRAQVHPVVASMPAEAEVSIETVGRFIAERETEPTRRVKALHDYVATRIAYDAPALVAGTIPPQDADTVFRTRLSVCAGYANLMAALGEVTGDEIEIVVGHARGSDGELSGVGHAWNAARIGDRWVLLDATWDAGHVSGSTFTREYETAFLMSPPEVFGVTHFPDDPRWQLRAEPLSRGEFLRQPSLRGGFFARGFQMRTPDRSQTTVDDELYVEIADPYQQPLQLFVAPRGHTGPFSVPCDGRRTTAGARAFECELPREGEYEIGLFSDRDYLGALQVNARG